MPPTVQTGKRDDRDHRQQRTGEKRSELVCKVKYNNTLPDIPFDPKFITYPFESNRFVEYNPTGLERNYKHELLTEHDLGVQIDLINPETYKIDHNALLDPEDEKLLEEEVAAPSDSKRSQRHNRSVSWLRKTEYISTEYNRFQQSAEKVEARVGYHIKKKFKEEDLYKDRASQIKAIEHTFDMTKEPITRHYSKAGVTALEVLPVFPDFEMWRHPYAQVIFDSDPTPIGRAGPASTDEMSQAMIRGMMDESGDQFVAYFIPTEDTLRKRKRDADDNIDFADGEEYDYTLAREYNWNVKNKASKGYEETYFFVFREDGVFYNELETRVRLSKRRKVGNVPANKSRLIVKHREPQPEELNTMNARLAYLEPQMEEEEEEELEVQEDNLQPTESGDEVAVEKEGSVRSRSPSRSRSRSRSRSKSRSVSRSRSRSRSKSKSRSPSRSRSRSRSRSGSRSSRSRSRSGSRSGSGSSSDSDDDNKKEAEKIFGSDSDSD